MKSYSLFPSLRLGSLLIATAFSLTACNNSSKPANDSTEQAEKENDAKFENKKSEKDAQFLVDATAFYLEAQKLSSLSITKGNAEVKKLDTSLVTPTSKGLKKVTDLAVRKQVSVPDSADNGSYTALSAKSGKEFNNAYCNRLLELYKKAVADFEKEAADSRDQDIKGWAAATLPDLRKHIDRIFECQKKCEKMS